jgi:hypothetical protein
MAFMVYSKQGDYLVKTGNSFSLAGYQLIYKLWVKRGKPTDEGWHITADDLIREHTNGSGSIETHSLLIDFHPTSRTRIGIIELLDIYPYSYPTWTPMMLRLRDVFYEEREISDEEKEAKTKQLKNPNNKEDFMEFLYLNGADKGWKWGANGRTNAAFIHAPAREYFRQYF